MARRWWSKPCIAVLAASLVAGTGCSPSSDVKDARPSVAHDADASHADAGGEPTPGAGGAAAADGGTGAAEGGGSTAPGDAAAPDARPASDAGPSGDGGTTPADAALPPLVCRGAGPRFATGVVSHTFGPGQSNGQEHFPEWVLGPPEGAPACTGATTGVVSLGNGGVVTLEFAGNAIVDGPGPDFIVFENPFAIDCNPGNLFVELATISVSDDGITWTDFPCTATKPPYGSCAGTHVVYANATTNTIDPTDPAAAGGDTFDLADIGVTRARFVRVTDRVDTTGLSGVFDLDAVSIVHPFCP